MTRPTRIARLVLTMRKIVCVGVIEILAALALPAAPRAEIYMGIGPSMTMGEVKEMFPGANFVKGAPAWAQETDALYSITGVGISGAIIVDFWDIRPAWRAAGRGDVATYLDSAIAATFSSAQIDSVIALDDDSALRVNCVRWVPDSPIPLTRLAAKYGPVEKSGFTDDDFQPYRSWPSRGITAYLDDELKRVTRIDFSFVLADYGFRKQTGAEKKGSK